MLELPTVADIRLIITTLLDDYEIEALIADAALIVGACVASLDGERQAAIIKYVTADLIAGTIATQGGGGVTSQRLGDASETYATAQGSTLGQSSYWRQALMLDPNGCLQRLGRRGVLWESLSRRCE